MSSDGQLRGQVLPFRRPTLSEPSDPPPWESLIREAIGRRLAPVQARIYVQKFFADFGITRRSCAMLYRCADQQQYVVKGPQVARTLVTEQVVGALAAAIDAAVPPVRLVDVPAALCEPFIKLGVRCGLSHGSLFVRDVIDADACGRHGARGPNRARMARLAILYGWVAASDHQFLFERRSPRTVWSVDHGNFFPGGPDWSIDALLRSDIVAPDPRIVREASLGPAELAKGCLPLRSVGPAVIAQAVAAPVDAWGVSMQERVELAMFLERRRRRMVALFDATEGGRE